MENIIESHLDEKNRMLLQIWFHSILLFLCMVSFLCYSYIQLCLKTIITYLNLILKNGMYLLERSKSTYCTSGLNSRPRVIYRVSHIEMFLLNWLWQIEICKLDFVWRYLYIPEVWKFAFHQPVFKKLT